MRVHWKLPGTAQCMGEGGGLLQSRRAQCQHLEQVSNHSWLKVCEIIRRSFPGVDKWGNQNLVANYRKRMQNISIEHLRDAYTLQTAHWLFKILTISVGIWRMKLKEPEHVRYWLSIGLWSMRVISVSKKSAWAIYSKNIPIYYIK